MKPKLNQMREGYTFDLLSTLQRRSRRRRPSPSRVCYWLRRTTSLHLYLRVDGTSAYTRRLTPR
jgi:hypothetical protein